MDERLYRVAEDFPRLSSTSFAQGLPSAIERIEYDVNLEGSRHLVVATKADDFEGPPT